MCVDTSARERVIPQRRRAGKKSHNNIYTSNDTHTTGVIQVVPTLRVPTLHGRNNPKLCVFDGYTLVSRGPTLVSNRLCSVFVNQLNPHDDFWAIIKYGTMINMRTRWEAKASNLMKCLMKFKNKTTSNTSIELACSYCIHTHHDDFFCFFLTCFFLWIENDALWLRSISWLESALLFSTAFLRSNLLPQLIIQRVVEYFAVATN